MIKSKITYAAVMRAFLYTASSRITYSGYIIDNLRRDLKMRTHAPWFADKVRRKLKSMEREGLFTRSRFTRGYYGYEWTLTDKGCEYADKLRAQDLKGSSA